jgi:hypothetical protein
MQDRELTIDPTYDPNSFTDWACDILECKNDAALARKLDMSPVILSKIRHRKIGPTAPMLIALHEETGLHIRDIKARMFREPLREAA